MFGEKFKINNKQLSFLQNNIKKVKEYKKNGYDKYEIEELNLTENVLNLYNEIADNLENKDKEIFKSFFIDLLNKAFDGGFSATDEREVLEILNKIKKKLLHIKGYKLETELNKELEKFIKEKYKKKLDKLEQEILTGHININIEQKLLNILTNIIPFNRTSKTDFNLSLDKEFIEKIKNKYIENINANYLNIEVINGLNLGINCQILFSEAGKNRNIYIRYNENKINKLFNNIDSFKYHYSNNKVGFHIKKQNKYIVGIIDKKGIKFREYTENEYHNIYGKIFININIDSIYDRFKNNDYKIKFNIKGEKKKSKKANEAEKKSINTKEYIKKLMYSENINKHLLNIINLLVGQVITVDLVRKGEKIKFSKSFFNRHKKDILENFRNLVLLFIDLESSFNPKARNKQGSSAIGLGQWLTNNGERKGKKRLTNSFETALNTANSIGNVKIKGVTYPIREKLDIKPDNLSIEEQVIVLSYTIAKKEKNRKHLLGALLGNEWSMKVLYSKYISRNKLDGKKCKGTNCFTNDEVDNIQTKYKEYTFKIYDSKKDKFI